MKRANIVMGVMSSVRLTVMLVFYVFLSSITPGVESQPSPVQEISTTTAANDPATSDQEMSPFLVVSGGMSLYSLPYTWPEAPDQSDAIHLFTEHELSFFYHITAISYHYRRRLMFWSATNGRVYTGSFMNRTKLYNVSHRQVIRGSLGQELVIGDVAVDWISDKVYWTIRDAGRIEELDLDTNQLRVVVQLERMAAFNGLAVYPYPNNGWIYWTDREVGTIERVAVTGEGNEPQLVRDVSNVNGQDLRKCIWPLEIDYSRQTLYWVNTCVNELLSIQISDSEQSPETVSIDSRFEATNSMTLFDNILYWNEDKIVKATNKSIELGEVVQLYQASEGVQFPIAMELVHPGKQPQEEEFVQIIIDSVNITMLNRTCPTCVNGACIPPGVCACDSGWTGYNCTTDVDECGEGKDDCDQECHNTEGSFLCSCNSTTYLDSDGKTCIPDVDECDEGIDGCDYECHNTLGSFYCSCNSTSYLDSDGKTCILDSRTTTTYVINPTISTGIGPEETPPGDHEFTTISITTAGPIHSRTIMASDSTLLPLVSSHYVVASSSAATVNIIASGTPTASDAQYYNSTSQPPLFLSTTSVLSTEPIFKSTASTPADSSLSTSDPTFLPKSTSSSSSTKSEPLSLFPKSTSLVITHSSSIVLLSPTETSRSLLATPLNSRSEQPKTTASSSSADELHKTTSTYYHIDYSTISVAVSSEQAGIAPSTTTTTTTTTTVGLTSSLSTAVLLLPSSTSPMASLATTASPTPVGPSTSSIQVLSVMPSSPISTSTTYTTRSQFTPSSVVLGPRETPKTAAPETTQSEADSSTPSSSGMTLIVIASAAAGACVLLIIVVIIMIAAVVHYASKRCGSYTVNPDPEKSNGAPSWISVSVGQSSNSAAPPAINHYATTNGHSNGHSYRTKSFRGSSPTCSTHSFT